MCRTLSVSKSAYYDYKLKRGKGNDSSELDRQVLSIFRKHRRRYGSRRIVSELNDAGIHVGRRKVGAIMSQYGLQAIQPKSFVPKTTQSPSGMARSPNLLLDRPLPSQINQVWVGDITYLPMSDGSWSYLSVWEDLYSRYIVGWHVADHMRDELVIESIKQGFLKRRPSEGVIIHSDGGGQYGSVDFRKLISHAKARQSMTRRNNHYDNAFVESLFSRFKAELLQGGCFIDSEDARKECFEYIEGYYNSIRKHSSLGYKSPLQFESE